ncbi:MAG: cytochrome P450 [Pseudomonadota bacterium]
MQASLPPVPIPPAKSLPIWRAIAVARRNTLAVIPARAFEVPVFDQSSAILGRSFLVSDPEGVKRVLLDEVANYPKAEFQSRIFAAAFGDGILTSAGETWRAHRRMMAPAFDPRSVEGHVPMMTSTAQAFVGAWRPGEIIDITEAMAELSLKIIARAMFSGAGEDLGPRMEKTLRGADAILARFGLLDAVPGFRELRRWGRERRITAGFAAFDGWISALIRARRQAAPGHDLLDRLIAARDIETGLGLSDREIRDQLVTIFVAGHETTAVALTWTWYLLAQNREVEARLHAELDASPGGPPVYARQVVEEAMRIFPPVPRIPLRQAAAEDAICGVRIPQGAYVSIAPWVIHRHRALWEDPERFDPERFSGERPPRFAYLPFGAGPRVCIGGALALTEAVVVLSEIARRYRLRLAPGQAVAMKPRMTLRPLGPIGMELVARAA